MFSGELEGAALVIDSFRKAVMTLDGTPMAKVLLSNLEALHSFLSADFEGNRKATDEGIAAADATGVHLVDVFILGHGAAGALSAGDAKRADDLLKRMRLCIDRNPTAWAESYYHNLVAWKWLLQRELIRASLHTDLGTKFTVASGAPVTEANHYLIKAIVTHELKREGEASACIAKVRRICHAMNASQAQFRCLLAESQFAFDRGDNAGGTDLLRHAMALGRERGYANAYFWAPTVMARLCVKALEAGIEVEYVQNLIRNRGLLPDLPPYDCGRWPWPLKILTLGRFELVKEREPLEFPVKAPRKMLSLLKVLVAFGSKGLSEEQLTDAIWPEAEGDLAHQAFATILHRLRQLLGNEKMIQLRKGHLRLDSCLCWADAHAFEDILERSEASEASDSMALLEKAIALYAGPFLGGEDSEPWAISYRERLRSKFLRAVGKLGHSLEKNRELEKAIDCYRRGLEVDGLAEEFYQRLMLCFYASGRKAEALAVYDRCRETFLSILGVEPSPQTESIRRIALKN